MAGLLGWAGARFCTRIRGVVVWPACPESRRLGFSPGELDAPASLDDRHPAPRPRRRAPPRVFAGAAASRLRPGRDEDRARARGTLRRRDPQDRHPRLGAAPRGRPHHLGSPYGQANAEWMAGLFRYWGYDTKIETYDVLFPTPKTRALEMLAPHAYRASLAEPALPEDATSGQAAEQLPIYNAYSIDGDVTGELVYVNYGVPADYEELDAAGHLGQGQDRDRALRRLLARHQAEGRGRARRDRLPDLLRPAGRRLLRGRRLPEGRLPQRRLARSAARWPTCRSTRAIR